MSIRNQYYAFIDFDLVELHFPDSHLDLSFGFNLVGTLQFNGF